MEIKKFKKVLFAGSWRTQSVSDELLRHISSQLPNKKMLVTNLKFGIDGLEMSILDHKGKVERQSKIALENMVDFIDNKYNTTCTLAIVQEKKQNYYLVYVFICRSDTDAAGLISSFKKLKLKLAGEGYNVGLTPNGNNWTFITKADTKEIQNGDGKQIKEARSGHSAEQIEHDRGVRRLDSESRESIQSSVVQDELQHLANEVRDIKRLLMRQSLDREPNGKQYAYRIAGSEQRTVGSVGKNDRAIATDEMSHPSYRHTVFESRKSPDKHQLVKTKSNPVVEYPRVEKDIPSTHIRFRNDHPKHVAGVIRIPERQYTKRVYSSKNPAAGRKTMHVQPQVPLRVMPSNWRNTFSQTHQARPPFSFCGDLVTRSIEDVYKSRSLRRVVVLPHHTNPKTTQYGNPVDVGPQNPTEQPLAPNVLHVYYKPEEAQKNGTTDYDTVEAVVDHDVNMSTIVNLSAGDDIDIDDNVLMNDDKDFSGGRRSLSSSEKSNYRTGEEVTEHNTNVVTIVLENKSDILADSRHERSFIRANDNNVHYVRAERLDEYKQRKERNVYDAEQDTEVRKITTDTYNAENDGLFGAYAKHPEDQVHLIQKKKAVLFHDESDNTDTDSNATDEDQSSPIAKEEIQVVTAQFVDTEESKSTEKLDEYPEARAENPDDDDDRPESDDNESENENDEEYDLDYEVLKAFSQDKDMVIVSSKSHNDSKPDHSADLPLSYDTDLPARDINGAAIDLSEDEDDATGAHMEKVWKANIEDDPDKEHGYEDEIEMPNQAESSVLF